VRSQLTYHSSKFTKSNALSVAHTQVQDMVVEACEAAGYTMYRNRLDCRINAAAPAASTETLLIISTNTPLHIFTM